MPKESENFARRFDQIKLEDTEHTAELIYLGQSGALNDSFSDVFACMVDRNDWLFGEDLYKYYHLYVAARDLSNPRNSRLPISQIDGLPGQPAHMDEYKVLPDSIDRGGVHYYCGIPNRAAYLIASQIGRSRTEKIYYRALCYYLLPQSNFEYAGKCLVQSAVDLYGINSIEQNTVISAFEEVGIFDNTNIIATFLREDFDDKQLPPSNWKLVPKNSNCTWYCGNLKTEYDFSQIDNNSKYSAICEGDSTNHQNECLYTPQFSLKNEIPYLKFYAFFHFNWLVNATLKVWIKSSSLAQWKEVWNAADLHDDGMGWAWREIQIDLSEYMGHSNIQLCWQYLGQKGGVIAIDKIRLKCTINVDVRQNENISTLPILFQLDQNYPNPFNPSTVISYQLPVSSQVELSVYNLLGQKIVTLVSEKHSAGIHQLNWDASGLASGVYLYRLEAGEFMQTKKLILVR